MTLNVNNKPCPCHSGTKYKKCCRPLHTHARIAQTPEELLRSRYAAYALGEADYIMRTTHPEHPEANKPEQAWRKELGLFARHTSFDSLEVLEQSHDETQGFITFVAGITQNGQDASFKERSHFVREEGRWLYASAETLEEA